MDEDERYVHGKPQNSFHKAVNIPDVVVYPRSDSFFELIYYSNFFASDVECTFNSLLATEPPKQFGSCFIRPQVLLCIGILGMMTCILCQVFPIHKSFQNKDRNNDWS